MFLLGALVSVVMLLISTLIPKGPLFHSIKYDCLGVFYLFHGGKNCKVVLLIDLLFPLKVVVLFQAHTPPPHTHQKRSIKKNKFIKSYAFTYLSRGGGGERIPFICYSGGANIILKDS